MLAIPSALGLPWNPWRESSSLNFAQPMLLPLPTQAVADFDGDRLPDRAELISDGFQKNIQFTFSSHLEPSLRFSSETQRPGSIYAEDIDRDSDEDLIWVSDGQSAQSALWLNNGVGELARVINPAAYDNEIKRMVAGGSRNGYLVSFDTGRPRATVTSGFYLPTLTDGPLPEALHSSSLKNPRRSCVAVSSSCISRYPKRGPPSFLF